MSRPPGFDLLGWVEFVYRIRDERVRDAGEEGGEHRFLYGAIPTVRLLYDRIFAQYP